MVFLKEDGSLDIDHINQLPVEKHMDMLGEFTSKQMEEYLSKLPVFDESQCPRAIIVDYGRDDPRSGVDADTLLRELRNKHGIDSECRTLYRNKKYLIQ